VSATTTDDAFIWATRGRTWTFRFLRRGGYEDPFGVYRDTFAEINDQPEGWWRVGDKVALRFLDPEGRKDAAGRVIPHDFVLMRRWAQEIHSLDDGRRKIWPLVADEFSLAWDNAEPPVQRG